MKTRDSIDTVRDMVIGCMQCGTCSGSCINAFAMDLTPRHLWRLVLMGDKETIFNSKTFAMCSACYYCTLRCPQGLPLTEAMAALKRIAMNENAAVYKSSATFNQAFINNIRKNGRIQEMEMMTAYFWSSHNPALPFQFAPLGTRLLLKHKVGFKKPPTAGPQPRLEALFRKVEELENR